VISIDVGVTNFAFAILGEDLILADKRRVCAWKGSKDYVNMTETVLGWFKPHIVPGTVLVIERQMRAGIMRLFQIALEVAWYHTTGTRALIVSPCKVKQFWGTSTGKYASNKNAAVKKMDEITEAGQPYERFAGKWSAVQMYYDKIDDVADAILQALWYRAVN